MRYEVIVGNVGTVYRGSNRAEALWCFAMWDKRSKEYFGRASGEKVTFEETN